jgi:excisionase family DNA binding protein
MDAPRFLALADVADVLNISATQAYALVRSGELPAIKIGGRGQWRVETSELEAYIQRLYAETREFVAAHPFPGRAEDLAPGALVGPDEHPAVGLPDADGRRTDGLAVRD